ncbi:MAG: hypothetical protein E6Y83_18465 [Clostridium butyricum]|nr:hypothetical protein [Clostridium butyricum]
MLDRLSKLKEITNISNYYGSIINEDIGTLSINFIYNEMYNKVDFVEQIIDICNICPVAINIKSYNTLPPLKKASTNIDEIRTNIMDHLNKHIKLHTNEISYVIIIQKNLLLDFSDIKNITWFYDVKCLLEILSRPLQNLELISLIFDFNRTNIILFINSNNIYFKNANCLFSSLDHDFDLINSFRSNFSNGNEKVSMRKNCCNIELKIFDIIPDYFIFDFNNNLFEFSNDFYVLLNNLFLMFCLIYISSYTSINNNVLEFKISSNNKIIECYFDTTLLTSDSPQYNYLIQLYYLCYNSLSLENLYLVRNMIALHISYNENSLTQLISKSKDILETSKENLNLLSIQNIEKYFSVRYDLYDFLDKSESYIENQISALIDKLNKTFLSTIATLIGVSFVYLKDRNLNVLKFSLLIYSLYLIVDCLFFFITTRKFYNSNNTKYIDKLDYFKPIIGQEHFKKITNTNTIGVIKRRFNIYYFIILSLYILIIILGLLSYYKTIPIINFIKRHLLFIL